MYDLIKIKKYFGENMMHLCRELFPTILEQEGLLFSILEEKFNYSKSLYYDIVESDSIEKFRDYIYSLGNIKIELPDTLKTPQELLEEAGYILHECHNEDDIQFFVGYYDYDEELCTFNGGRLQDCHVFFAVKKNVDEINRWDFKNPQREDEYGTSVISIQFTRGKNNVLSIKNRYNHTVENPDATFSNNLENIIPGLTRSFEKKYNLKISQNEGKNFELPGYVKTKNGKYYKYNYEINNIYYCPGNIIISNFELDESFIEKEKYLIIDYFIIDLMNKKIFLYDKKIKDSFIDDLQNIKNISIIKTEEGKIIELTLEGNKKAYIEIDKNNKIIGYKNENITNIGDYFLSNNKIIKSLDLPKVKKIGEEFLYCNLGLSSIKLPNVLEIGAYFLRRNKKISVVELPRVKKINSGFLDNNLELKKIKLPNVEEVGRSFLLFNENLEVFEAPNLKEIGNSFLANNKKLKRLDLPKVEIMSFNVLTSNQELEYINMPNIKEIGYGFLFEHPKANIQKIENLEFDFLKEEPEVETKKTK